ncbi:MAG: PD-(D/E)XK nuclease family protein, partial [Candidatus Cloacimonetes bacterium]|nr:PD-(D/E)XK nuclease family protein [Candidatus Cloacimonadota bacterium]
MKFKIKPETFEVFISVKDIVEFTTRSGDLSQIFISSSRAKIGTKLHQKIQKSRPDNYTSELSIVHISEIDNIIYEIKGRIDGVFTERDRYIIEEIKSTSQVNVVYNQFHWAQAKIYAYIYAKQNNLPEIEIQLTYINIETERLSDFLEKFSFSELEDFYDNILNQFHKWIS